LLGPFEVEAEGRPVSLTTGRLRALLATLAVSADRLVTVDQLAEAVWDEDLPSDVRRSVSTYVTRLRAVLGRDAISTGPQGYALRVGPDDVDAVRFVRLVEDAQRRTDPGEQEPLLRAALRLWRGMPFEGVPSRWLAATRAPRLVEAYLAAREQRIDLDLGRANHAGLVAELTELTCRYPLRESLWLRLLAVLDRTGCSAEALARYERMRVHLAEELGVDPGPELQRAYADLLAGRPVRLTDQPRGPATRLVPGQLPADLDTFTGRAAALAELDAFLSGGGTVGRMPVVVIHGPAGVGKTALAVHWAHRVTDRFPDGHMHVDLRAYDADRSALSAAEAIKCLLDSMPSRPEQIPAGLPAQAALFRSLLAGKRMLLVLDNAHAADQVRPLLPGAAGCLVLVTSRNELSGLVTAEGAHPVRLDLFTAAESRQMLVRRLGEERVATTPDAVDEIIDRCAGLPLALAIVAARAATNRGFSLAALSGELRGTSGGLDAFAGGDAATDLRAVFSWSYRTLTPAAAGLFRRLGLPAAPDITAPAAAALAGVPPRAARLLLAELARANLVREHQPGRYVLHDLLHAFAAELADERIDPAEQAAAITGMLGFYLSTAWHTLPLLSPGDHRRLARADERWRSGGLALADETAALRWLDAERANLLAAVRQAATTPDVPPEIACQLADALYAYFSIRPHWDEWAEVNRTALAVARRLGDRRAEAQATHALGFIAFLRGRFDEAKTRYVTSLAICRALGDRAGVAARMAGLADVHRLMGGTEQAVAHYEESLAICRQLDDLYGQTMSLGSLGMLYQAQGRSAEALECHRDSLAIREKLGDRRGQATSLCNLGGFHHREGRYDEALVYYEQSLTIRRQQGDRHGEGTSLAGLGAVYQEIQRPLQALGFQRASVTIFRDLMDAQCLAENLRPLGVTLSRLGRAEEAEELRREAAVIFARLGSPAADPAAPTSNIRVA
jgi:DNA-binding SARP family transcriptional activator/tetratricopeptide (TPR) repeat protein